MTPELEKFIELATRPLEGREAARDEARGELMGRLSHQGVPLEMIDVSGPTERLEAAGRLPTPWRRGLVLGLLLVMLAAFFFGVGRDGSMLARFIYLQELGWRSASGGVTVDSNWDRFFFGWLDRRAPDLPIRGLAGEIDVLRQDHPEDLAILQEALLWRSIDESAFMTPGERALVARLDPGNALWPLLEMRWELCKARGYDPSGGYHYGGSVTPDAKAEERARERFAEAARCGHFHAHGRDLGRRQRDACPEAETVLEDLLWSRLVQLPRSVGQGMRGYYEADFAGAGQVEALFPTFSPEYDEALLGLFEDWKKVWRLLAAPEHPDAMTVFGALSQVEGDAQTFQSAFAARGMAEADEEAEQLIRKLSLGGGRVTYRNSDPEAGMRYQIHPRATIGATPEELKPGRRADMAMFHRMLMWPLILVAVIFILLCGFEACRRSLEVKGMAKGLLPLLTRRDHLQIAVAGLLVPWLYWWTVTRLTPVGISDKVFGDDEWVALAWVLQIALGMVLGLVMLTQAVHWRWAQVGGFLGLAGHVPWLGRAVAWLVAAALPVVGLIRFLPDIDEEHKGYFMLACAGMGAIGVLWLLWIGIMNLCTPRHGALRPNLVSRTLIPWSLAGLGSLLLVAGGLRLAEGWWLQRDPLVPAWTSEHYPNALQERAVMKQVESLRAAFGK